MSLRAGQLRDRILFEKPNRIRNAVGEKKPATWTPAFTAFAEIKPAAARETLQIAQVQHQTTHLIRLRYTALVTPDMRIRFCSRIFNITGVENVENRNAELRITASETT